METKKSLEWRKHHIENIIWNAKNKQGLFSNQDLSRYYKELNKIKKELKNK